MGRARGSRKVPDRMEQTKFIIRRFTVSPFDFGLFDDKKGLIEGYIADLEPWTLNYELTANPKLATPMNLEQACLACSRLNKTSIKHFDITPYQ